MGDTRLRQRKRNGRETAGKRDKQLRCNEPGCTYEGTFRRRYELERHRKGPHRCIPAVGDRKFYRCLQEECANRDAMSRPEHFRKHIATKHRHLDIEEQIRMCAVTHPDAPPAASQSSAAEDESRPPEADRQKSTDESREWQLAPRRTSFGSRRPASGAEVAVPEGDRNAHHTPPPKFNEPGQTPRCTALDHPQWPSSCRDECDPARTSRRSPIAHFSLRTDCDSDLHDFGASTETCLQPLARPYRRADGVELLVHGISATDPRNKGVGAPQCSRVKSDRGRRPSTNCENSTESVLGRPISAPPCSQADAADAHGDELADVRENSSGQPHFHGHVQANGQVAAGNGYPFAGFGGQLQPYLSQNGPSHRSPSVSTYSSPRSMSGNGQGRFPCFWYDWVLGIGPTPQCSNFQAFVSQLEPHIHRQRHSFFPCTTCFTVFPTLRELQEHGQNGQTCDVRCVTEGCQYYHQQGRPCLHGGEGSRRNAQESIWRALYRLAHGLAISDHVPGIPAPPPPPMPTAANGPLLALDSTAPTPHQPTVAQVASGTAAPSIFEPQSATTATDVAGYYAGQANMDPIDLMMVPLEPYDQRSSTDVVLLRQSRRLLFLAQLMWVDVNRESPGWHRSMPEYERYERAMERLGFDRAAVNEEILDEYDDICALINAYARFLSDPSQADEQSWQQIIILKERVEDSSVYLMHYPRRQHSPVAYPHSLANQNIANQNTFSANMAAAQSNSVVQQHAITEHATAMQPDSDAGAPFADDTLQMEFANVAAVHAERAPGLSPVSWEYQDANAFTSNDQPQPHAMDPNLLHPDLAESSIAPPANDDFFTWSPLRPSDPTHDSGHASSPRF